jgi:hypothetical protein
MSSKKISWQALDHIQDPKSSDWFWIVGIVAISIAVLAVFFGNILFALLIILAAFSSFMIANDAPQIIDFEINRQGVKVGDTVYPYSTLDSFYVIDEDGWDRDRILIKSKKLFMPLIVMPIGNEVSPDGVRDYLLDYLDEEELEEPMSQRFLEILGF